MGYELDSVVYSIRNTINGKNYVGSSSNLKMRKRQHFSDLRCGRHPNIHLQRSFNKYGEQFFELIVLEVVGPDLLPITEKKWMERLGSCEQKKGYNLTPEPYAPMRGKKHTEEAKRKISLAERGEKHHNCKINDSLVKKIYELGSIGLKQTEIAKQIGICQPNISAILRGNSWKHLIPVGHVIKNRFNNKSGCVGVYRQESGRWKAEIIRDGKYKNLGSFENKEEAIAARKAAEKE